VIGGLLLLVVLVGLGYGLVQLTGSRRNAPAGGQAPSPADLRQQVARLFRLALLAGAVALTAEGVAGLVAEAVPRAGELARDPATLSRALAFTVVGVPVLFGLARWQRAVLARDPEEDASGGWGAYLGVAEAVSLLVALTSLDGVAGWALGLSESRPGALGRSLTWGAVWLVHWRLAAQRRAAAVVPAQAAVPTHLVFGSAIGLLWTAVGVGAVIEASLQRIYERLWLTTLVADSADPFLRALVLVVLGAATWWWYWFRHTEPAARTPARDAFVLLGGVLGGLIAAVVGAAQLLYHVLEWFFADPDPSGGAAQFASSPGMSATAVVGALVWWYHRGVVARQADEPRSELSRVYSYLGAAVGLVTTAVAVTIAVVAICESLSRGSSLVQPDLAGTVVLAVTLLVVGGPVWGLFWRAAQQHDAEPAEIRSVSRRVYLLLVLGIAAVVALVALVILLITFFEDLTQGALSSTTLYRLRVPAGLVLSTGALAAYHATVFRADHRAAAALPPPPVSPVSPAWARPAEPAVPGGGAPAGAAVGEPVGTHLGEVVLLSAAADRDAVAGALHDTLGVRVRSWHLATGTAAAAAGPGTVDAAAVADLVRAAAETTPDATRVVVVVDADGGTAVHAVLPD